ncbi:hypothetical protein JRQ81_010318, partial [Phrynocephalus forsythii]
ERERRRRRRRSSLGRKRRRKRRRRRKKRRRRQSQGGRPLPRPASLRTPSPHRRPRLSPPLLPKEFFKARQPTRTLRIAVSRRASRELRSPRASGWWRLDGRRLDAVRGGEGEKPRRPPAAPPPPSRPEVLSERASEPERDRAGLPSCWPPERQRLTGESRRHEPRQARESPEAGRPHLGCGEEASGANSGWGWRWLSSRPFLVLPRPRQERQL